MMKNDLRLCQEKFRLYIRKKFFAERIVKHWSRLSREGVVSSALEVFKRYVNMELSNMVY